MAFEAQTASRRGTALPPTENRAGNRATVVIADSGDTASVMVVHTDRPLSIGSEFWHEGRMWRVSGRRPLSRALIACPARA
jgi:hypothetical protein